MQAPTTPQGISLDKQYTKKCIFEVPNGPIVFKHPLQSDYKLELNVDETELSDIQQQVVLTLDLTVKSTHEDQTAYKAVIQQAGIFTFKNIPKKDQKTIIHTTCATALHPYAIERLNNAIIHGGFPPMTMMPLNFAALYARSQKERAAQPKFEESPKPSIRP